MTKSAPDLKPLPKTPVPKTPVSKKKKKEDSISIGEEAEWKQVILSEIDVSNGSSNASTAAGSNMSRSQTNPANSKSQVSQSLEESILKPVA